MANLEIRGIGKPVSSSQKKTLPSNFDQLLQESQQKLEASPQYTDPSILNTSLNLRSMSGVNLDNNRIFQDLKQKLQLYYIDIRKKTPTLHPDKFSHWKKVLYTSLHKLLNQIVFTKSPVLQRRFLSRVCNWYYQKVGKLNTLQPQIPLQVVPQQQILSYEQDTQFQPPSNLEKLNSFQRRQISSSTNLRPKTAPIPQLKWLQTRPPSGFKPPVLPYTGQGEPQIAPAAPPFRTGFIAYKPLGSKVEQEVQKKFYQKREKNLSEKRLRQEMNSKINQWTFVKQKREEEVNRKIQCNRFASKFDQRGIPPSRPQTAAINQRVPVYNLSQQIIRPLTRDSQSLDNFLVQNQPHHKMNKIQEIRLMNAKVLGKTHDDIQQISLKPSMSAYSLGNQEVWARQTLQRPNTAGGLPPVRNNQVFGLDSDRPITEERARQIEEVLEVKKTLARNRIQCSIDCIRYALLMPQDLPGNLLTHQNLPVPGSGLMHNKNFSINKKSKSRKKLRRGRKGK